MPSLGNLWYTMGIKDLTDADLKKINDKLKNAGSEILLTPTLVKSISEILPKGTTLELDPQLKAVSNEALQKAVEGKVMKVEIAPLVTSLRKALRDATKDNPPEMEVGVQSAKLRKLIETVLNKQGFLINISTVNDNYSKVVQQKLNGTRYTVKIHADAKEITQSVQASLMQVQSRYFGLRVSRDILYRSIDEALGVHRFPINIVVQQDQARKAVQDALLRAQVMGKDQALAYQRLQTGELKAAQAELARLKTAQMGAASAAKAHATASIDLGGAMGSNIKIAGELGSAMASLYSIHAAKEFLSQVIEIGGELEHQKIAMDTIFGDKGKTNELFGQIKGLARQSPFGVMELTNSVKALSAYGVEYNEIYDTAKRLADISAATSVDINRLILAFGKTKSRGFLDGLEAKQFAYANIPIYEMVRKKLEELEGQAVTTADVMARMKKREIGFDIVKDVLWDISDPGGKFYNMQEALAGSVKTSWKLVRDNIELMFGEIAEGVVGDSLKSTAEILQGLTREWRTVAAVVSAAAVGLGVYKVATIGLNQVMQQGTAKTYENLMAAKQRDAQRLRSTSLVMELSAAEKARLATVDQLTTKELRNAVANDTLTLSQVEQLYVTGKLNKAHILSLYHYGQIDKATAKAILSNNRFTISLKGIGMALSRVGKAVKAFLLNPWTITIAAISAVTAIWQRHSEQVDKAKEIGDNLFTRATESAKNLQSVLADIGNDIEKLTDIKIAEAISKLETAIKDYSPSPEKTIRDAKVDEDGKIRSAEEYAKALQAQVQAMKEAAEIEEKIHIDKIVSNAMDSASSWKDDNLEEDLQDYVDAYNDAEQKITKFISEYRDKADELVNAAMKEDSAFKMEAETLSTLEARFNLLIKQQSKFAIAYNGARKAFQKWGLNDSARSAYIKMSREWNFVDPQSTLGKSRKEAEKELRENIKYIKTALKKEHIDVGEGVKISLPVKIMLSNLGNSLLENAKNLPPEFQDALTQIWNESMGIDFDDSVIFSQISEKMADNIGKLSKDLSTKLRAGISYSDLEAEEREDFDRLMTSMRLELEKEMPHLTYQIRKSLNNEKFKISIAYSLGQYSSLDEWKQELFKSIGDSPIIQEIKGVADVASMQDAVRKAYKEAKETLTKLGTMELPIGVSFSGEKIPEEGFAFQQASELQKQVIREYNKNIEIINGAKAIGKATGFNPAVDPNKRQSQKDPFAEAIKERINLLKKAKSEYESLAKSMGADAASNELAESPIFAGLKANKFLPGQEIPRTLEDYEKALEELQKSLIAKGLKTQKHRELNIEIEQVKLDIKKKKIDEALKLALDTVTKEAERQLADWNLFDKIRKATGNQDFAMSIAFGMNADAETDYPTIVKKQFDDFAKAAKSTLTFDTATPELLAMAPEEVQRAWEDTTKKLQQYAREQKDAIADILSEYQSLQDKLVTIDADRDRKIKTVEESDMSEEDKESYIRRINVSADYQKFTQSNEYLRFFNDIYGLTMTEANRIGDLIQLNLNKRLQAGLLTIYDYEKEMEKVRKQLESIRNVKSDAMTVLSGGLKGLAQKKLQKEEGRLANNNEYQKALEEQVEAQQKLDEAREQGNFAAILAAQKDLNLANAKVKTFTQVRDALIKDMEMMENVLSISTYAGSVAQGLSDSFNTIRDTAEALGVDTSSGAWDDIGAVMDTLTAVTGGIQTMAQSAINGDIGGVLSGLTSTIATPFTIWSQLHDKKLQKMIDRSKEAAQIMQNQYDILEKQMANFLGNAAAMDTGVVGGAYGKQHELMKGQLAELEKQRQLEADKKNSDDSVLTDYDQQIQEMKISIQDFAVEVANTVYGIDLNGWAEQLGDALVDAFAAGEDAAEEFDNTVGDIMRGVTSKMISQDLLAPMFGDLRNFLFGKNGESGALGSDYTLSPEDAAKMQKYIDRIKNKGIPAAQELYEAIDSATGGLLSDSSASDSLREGIEGIKEDQADLLASYLNAVRADVSIQTTVHWPRLLDESLPQISVIAQSQLDCQRRIAEYARRNAVAAEAIVESTAKLVELNDQMGRSWRRIAERNWGYS